MDLLIIVIITVVVETKKCMQVLEEVASTEVSTKATKKKNCLHLSWCLFITACYAPPRSNHKKKYLWDLGNGTGRRRRRLQGAVIFPFTVNSSVMRSSLNWRGVGCYDF